MPIVAKNDAFPAEIWGLLRKSFDEKRTGTHVSDLVFPKSTYWRRIYEQMYASESPAPTMSFDEWYGKKLGLSDDEISQYRQREVGFWLAGEGHHTALQRIFDAHPTATKEKEIRFGDIEGHIDISLTEDESESIVEVEVKTTRAKRLYDTNSLPPHWITQLGMYVAMTTQDESRSDDVRGRILIFHLNLLESELDPDAPPNLTTPWFASFDVAWKDAELAAIRLDMVRRKEEIELAVKMKDPSILPDCPRWKCTHCRFQSVCKEGFF